MEPAAPSYRYPRGRCSSVWASHLEPTWGLGRLLGGKETLSLPFLGLWLAATVTSPPPRRAVSREVGGG